MMREQTVRSKSLLISSYHSLGQEYWGCPTPSKRSELDKMLKVDVTHVMFVQSGLIEGAFIMMVVGVIR